MVLYSVGMADQVKIMSKNVGGRGNITPVPDKSELKLSRKKREIIKATALAVANAKTQTQAAEQLGISRSALVKRLQQYPAVYLEVDKIRKIGVDFARSRVLGGAEDSANRILALVDSATSENVQLNAAIEVLDRAGIVKPQQQNNIQVNVLNQLNKDKDSFGL